VSGIGWGLGDGWARTGDEIGHRSKDGTSFQTGDLLTCDL
jgi:hypothetical protein